MLRSRNYLAFILVAVAATAAGVTYFGAGDVTASSEANSKAERGSEQEPLQLDADTVRRAGIKVERLEQKDYAATLGAFGTVGPNRNSFARVTAPVAGRLVGINVDLGTQVRANTALATLESPELAEARTTFNQNQTELDLARINLDRARKLSADASIAQKDFLRAQADYERAQAALTASEAKLKTLNVPAKAPEGMSPANLTIAAPIAGSVVERTAVLGEYAQAYQALFTIADLSTVWVEASIYERDLPGIAVGAKATVTVSAYPDRQFDGEVTYVASILDKDTRTATARIEVANADGALRPGLFANISIEKPERRPALRVPEGALVLLQGQTTAFVAEGKGFEPRPVEIGERIGGMAIIKSGLEAGDQVVVSGAYALKARLLKSQLGEGH